MMNSFLAIFFLVLWCSSQLHCGVIHPYYKGLEMGIGSDYQTGKTYRIALKNTDTEVPEYPDGQESQWELTQVSSEQQIYEALGISASWSIKSIFGPSASGHIQFLRSCNVNRYSTHLLVRASIKNPTRNIKNPILSDEAIDVIQNRGGLLQFEKYYGVEYLGGVISGGMYLGMITIDTQDEEERKNVIASVTTLGFGAKLEERLSNLQQSVMKNRSVFVNGVQIGGEPQSLATTLSDMIQQLQTFPDQVLKYPVPIEGIFHKYKDTIPFDWECEGTEYKVRDRILQELGAQLSTLKDRKNDLLYVQNHYDSFEAYKPPNPTKKNQTLHQISNEINEINVETNKLNKYGLDCADNIRKCQEPTFRYTPVFTLPIQRRDDLSESAGMALMYFGKIEDIPYGWQLCDGSNNTPDLRGRFPVGYTDDNNYGSGSRVKTNKLRQSGGYTTKTLSVSEMPQHDHTVSSDGKHTHTISEAGSHQHRFDDYFHSEKYCNSYPYEYMGSTRIGTGDSDFDNDRFCLYRHSTESAGAHNHNIGNEGSHSHTVSVTGQGQQFSIVNPYESVYFICKTK